jgi:hypothetical protein
MSDGANQSADLQDPLPEASWLWRRVFVFTTTAAVLWMLWAAIDRLAAVALAAPALGVPALLSLCKWIIGFSGLMATYYMVAPSAEQIVKMLKTAALLRSGVQVAGRQTVNTHEGTTDTAKTVGRPPAPPIPGRGAAKGPSAAPDAVDADDGPPWTLA